MESTSDRTKALVMLSRTLYHDADIMIFDDVLAMLDSNERKLIVTNVFKGLCNQKTVVLTTNSLEVIYESDRIAVMKQGEIEAFGTLD